jgi:hypothetical protein
MESRRSIMDCAVRWILVDCRRSLILVSSIGGRGSPRGNPHLCRYCVKIFCLVGRGLSAAYFCYYFLCDVGRRQLEWGAWRAL